MIGTRRFPLTRILSPVILLVLSAHAALAQGTAFTYQGKLSDAGNPASGNYDMQFKLFDAASGGAQQGATVTLNNVAVTAGIFTVQLDFGACPACFNGAARFLEIAVKKTTDATFTLLAPRQPLTSTPYAIRSLNAAAADGLSLACINCVTSSQIASVSGSAVTGTIPVASVPAGSSNYIQNQSATTQAADFNIGGTGTASIINAATQYNLGGQRVLSTPGSFNVFAGKNSGTANTTGDQNAFFGDAAGQNNTQGSNNSFFGNNGGFSNTTGSFNSFFGSFAGNSNTTGSQNSFFGLDAGQTNTVQHDNTFIGYFAGSTNGFNDTTGDANFNTFVGSSAGQSNTTGGANSFFGYRAGFHNLSAGGNSYFGALAGFSNTTGIQNAFFGYLAGSLNQATCCNSFFGYNAGQFSTASDNSFFGNTAGGANRTGTRNSFFGSAAGFSNVAESDNTFFGYAAGRNNGTNDSSNTANFNTFVGSNAGFSNTTGGANSFFGHQAGFKNTTGQLNTFFGETAGNNNTTEHDNTFLGTGAGFNTGIGTPGIANSNTFVGSEAGINNTIGVKNTIVGADADVGAANLANATAIGANAIVARNNSIVLGSINGVRAGTADTNIGIGTTTPGFKLHIAGHTNADWPIIKLQNIDSGGHAWWLYAGAGGTTSDFGIFDETLNAYRLYINGSNGNVGINTTPVDRLDVFGDIRIGAVNGCVRDRVGNVIAGTCGSDARLKRDVTPFPRLLDKLAGLQPVTFYWRAEQFPDRHFGSAQSYGLIAQEVEKVLPELVSEDEQGYKMVNYSKLPLLTLQAVKELKQENEALKQKLSEQQQEIVTIKNLLCRSQPQADLCKAAR